MRQVPFEEVLGFAERNDVFHAMETSAKENINIEETFIELARVTKSYKISADIFLTYFAHVCCFYVVLFLFDYLGTTLK